MSTDPYQLLGVDRDATLDDVRAAYRKAALKCHPDVFEGDRREGERLFRELTAAYEDILRHLPRQKYKPGKASTPAELATVEVARSLAGVRAAFHKARRKGHSDARAADPLEAVRRLRDLSEAYKAVLQQLFTRETVMQRKDADPQLPGCIRPEDAHCRAEGENDTDLASV
jgi:DnaJ-class molecular chaperone